MSTTAPSWRTTVDWWTDPRLAYAAGLADGHARGWREGYDACDQQLVRALAEALGGPDIKDYPAAVEIHHKRIDQKRQRDQFDAKVRDERGRAA